MLQPIMHILNSQRIVLASSSPRRKTILENVGLKFDVIPSTFEENLDKKNMLPQDYVVETAKLKTLEVADRMRGSGQNIPGLIIGADTVVSQDQEIIEKPHDKDDGIRILNRLSGRSHTVYTGVVLFVPASASVLPGGTPVLDSTYRCKTFVENTDVYMQELSSEVIEAYIDTGESMDKAGGYGIQALGGTLVERINGDFFNVMGFPLPRFAKELLAIYQNKC